MHTECGQLLATETLVICYNIIEHVTDYNTGLRLSVCQCVSVSVRLRALSRSHFLIHFHQIWHRRKNPKSKNEFFGVNIAPPVPHSPENILGREVPKIHANINNPISALNVRESPIFSRL